MPKEFQECVDKKGRLVTKKIGNDKYVYGCTTDGKNFVWGEVHKKKMTLREAHRNKRGK